MADSVDQTSKLIMPMECTTQTQTLRGYLPVQNVTTKQLAGVNFAQNRAVVFVGCLGTSVLNTPGEREIYIYNDVVIINNDHYIIVMMSFWR